MTEVSETRTLKLPRHYNQICSMWLSLPRLDKMSTSGRAKPDPPPPVSSYFICGAPLVCAPDPHVDTVRLAHLVAMTLRRTR